MTIVEKYEKIREMVAEDAELVEFIDSRIALATKPRKETAKQVENAKLVEEIYEAIKASAEGITSKALVEKFEMSSQKVSALTKKLVDAGRITKEVAKVDKTRVTTYKIAE